MQSCNTPSFALYDFLDLYRPPRANTILPANPEEPYTQKYGRLGETLVPRSSAAGRESKMRTVPQNPAPHLYLCEAKKPPEGTVNRNIIGNPARKGSYRHIPGEEAGAGDSSFCKTEKHRLQATTTSSPVRGDGGGGGGAIMYCRRKKYN